MAREWYLMESPHDQLSGFESEALDDFAQEGFLEILNSDIATEVELCNYNLSKRQQIKAIVQNTIQDTKLKTLSRQLLTEIGTCKAGMYVYYSGRYWLIVGVVDNNKVYEKSILSLCNHLLTWQNPEGKVVQRWANVLNASQYNNGEQKSKFYTVRSDQLLVFIADDDDDDDGLRLTSGQRFIIDKRCKLYTSRFNEDVTQDTSNPVLTYKITRVNNVIDDYQDSGYLEFMLDEDEQHEEDGYYVIDDNGYWLCGLKDKTEPSEDKITVLTSEIVAESYEVMNGVEPSVFMAKFYDEDGNEVNVDFTWEIESDFTDKLEITYADNAIYIYVDDNKLINKSFNLLLHSDDYDTVSAQIVIKAFI